MGSDLIPVMKNCFPVKAYFRHHVVKLTEETFCDKLIERFLWTLLRL